VDETDQVVYSFDAVYEQNVDAIFGFLARRVGPDLAEELTSQTFLEAFVGRESFDPDRGSQPAWLFGIAVNLLRHHYRHEERGLRAMANLAGRLPRSGQVGDGIDEDALADRLVAGERWATVARALADLAPGERDVLLLYAWAELSYADIASVLGVPVGTVRSRLNRARSHLSVADKAMAAREVRCGL
jgi:RNA polymerase sigma-70 factor (ECF subfamily)